MPENTSVAIVHTDAGALVPLIDIEATKLRLENIRQFVDAALDKERGHYGRMPGVDRDFLKQPGAEILAVAMDLRVDYEIVSEIVDRATDYCRFIVRARLIGRGSGTEEGSADGAASSDEYASRCPTQRTWAR